jgi:hypothetical protein
MVRTTVIALLYCFQGLAIWAILENELTLGDWQGGIFSGALAGLSLALALWPMWHDQRGWRPWLQWLALIGATYWLPGLGLKLKQVWFPPDPPGDRSGRIFIDPVLLFDLVVSIMIVQVLLMVVTTAVVRRATGWRLRAGDAQPPPFSLKEMFALTTVVAVHLFFAQDLVRHAIEWDWKNIADWVLTKAAKHLAFFAIPITLLGVATWRACLRRPLPWRSSAVWGVLGLAGLPLAVWFAAPDDSNSWEDRLWHSCWMAIGLIGQCAVHALVLRWCGYRLLIRGERG